MEQAREHLERGGLARAIRPEEAHNLAAADAEADFLDRLDILELAAEETAYRRVESGLPFGDAVGLAQRVNDDGVSDVRGVRKGQSDLPHVVVDYRIWWETGADIVQY